MHSAVVASTSAVHVCIHHFELVLVLFKMVTYFK